MREDSVSIKTAPIKSYWRRVLGAVTGHDGRARSHIKDRSIRPAIDPSALAGHDRRARSRIEGRSIRLVIDGTRYKMLDWSLGGFRIAGFDRTLSVSEEVAGEVLGSRWVAGGAFTAELCWSRDGQVGFRFLDISSRTFLSMTHRIEN